jgi:hypothetical protein
MQATFNRQSCEFKFIAKCPIASAPQSPTAIRESGTCWVQPGNRRYCHCNQYVQQSGGNYERFLKCNECLGDRRMLVRQRVETITHVVEAVEIAQD